MILTVNAGSSSIRLDAFAGAADGLHRLAAHHGDIAPVLEEDALRTFIEQHELRDIAAVAHRVVHGGDKFIHSCLVEPEVEQEIERLSTLAPLHNPPALRWLRACRALLGADVPQVAVFDTAFYADLPEVARTYALPRELCQRHAIRRYGFHGIAHEAMWRRWQELHPDSGDGGRVISLQLGAGCSISAVHGGKAVDTSMGFSPLEGLVMATRCGDVDAGLLLYLQRAESLSPAQIEVLLNEKSGLRGISGLSGDMRCLLGSGDPAARLAIEVYAYRVRKYIGAYLAALGGADAILIGGGVGEHAPAIREAILARMEWCGIALGGDKNRAVQTEACISGDGSAVDIWVIPVDEAAILAQEALIVTHRPATTTAEEGKS